MTPTPLEAARETCRKIAGNIATIMRGQTGPTRHLLAALAGGGHVLLEIFRARARRRWPKALARSIDAQFKRLQFTPDLLPSDILGVSVFSQRDQQFHFHEGQFFTNILLADEINRASPRTQSALLEAMARRSVSVEGERRNFGNCFLSSPRKIPSSFAHVSAARGADGTALPCKFTLGYVQPEGRWPSSRRSNTIIRSTN